MVRLLLRGEKRGAWAPLRPGSRAGFDPLSVGAVTRSGGAWDYDDKVGANPLLEEKLAG